MHELDPGHVVDRLAGAVQGSDQLGKIHGAAAAEAHDHVGPRRGGSGKAGLKVGDFRLALHRAECGDPSG